MFYSPGPCGEYGLWGTRGWWSINPGGEAFPLRTENRYAAYYAEADDGTTWSGTYGRVYVHPNAFDSCLNIGDTNPDTRVVGMRLTDLAGVDRHYVNLRGSGQVIDD